MLRRQDQRTRLACALLRKKKLLRKPHPRYCVPCLLPGRGSEKRQEAGFCCRLTAKEPVSGCKCLVALCIHGAQSSPKPFLMGGVISIFQTQKPMQRGSWALPPPCLLPPWPAEGESVVVAQTRSRSSASKAELYLPDPAASWRLLERIALRNEHHSKPRSLGWKGPRDSPPPHRPPPPASCHHHSSCLPLAGLPGCQGNL